MFLADLAGVRSVSADLPAGLYQCNVDEAASSGRFVDLQQAESVCACGPNRLELFYLLFRGFILASGCRQLSDYRIELAFLQCKLFKGCAFFFVEAGFGNPERFRGRQLLKRRNGPGLYSSETGRVPSKLF